MTTAANRCTRVLTAALLVFSSLAACSTPQMRIDAGLVPAAGWPVSGREGWLVDQRLAFGGYQSGPVSRGWTKGYDYPFFVRFSGAREKLRFEVRDGAGNEALVHCAGKLREVDLRVFRDYFDANVYTTDTLVGTIQVNGERFYDFWVENANTQQSIGYRPLDGEIRGVGTPVRLRAVWQLESGQRWLGTQPIGVELLQADRVIAAVETVNDGRVWMRDDLDPETRLLAAAMASALLLRSGLADHNDS